MVPVSATAKVVFVGGRQGEGACIHGGGKEGKKEKERLEHVASRVSGAMMSTVGFSVNRKDGWVCGQTKKGGAPRNRGG